MKCPYCGAEMEEGTIYGDRYPLKWLPKDHPLMFGIWVVDGLKLGPSGLFFGRHRVDASLCQSCRKMVIDLMESNP
jgi:hypothetical protein